jgi:hypothetical protein
MTTLISRHRAVLGLAGVAALAGLFFSLAFPATTTAIELLLLAVAILGLYAIVGSPYWSIVYRESPLKRAMTGVSDLDERELALRDRAAGLTYFLFTTINVVALALCWILVGLDKIDLRAPVLQAAIFPYAWFAVTLPVLMMEWFEPSGDAVAAVDREAD